ncbi:hypothetical protein LP415_06485 [Polaromonas sp. P1(28)-8]|nr:hypothetical protein LP415_06485 [Polaromonas sp. P1(28)-8]
MIDMLVFKQFQEAIEHLGEMAQPEPIADEERVSRAKAVMRRKTDRGLALDLEACVNCGYCSEACHFYQPTRDPKYTPTRKLDLLRRVHAGKLGVRPHRALVHARHQPGGSAGMAGTRL